MLNLIKADLYKYRNRPYFYIFNLCMVVGIILVGVMIAYFRDRMSINESLVGPILGMFGTSSLFLLGFSEVVCEEYKSKTLKNVLASNISRNKIFIEKIMIQLLLALLTFVISSITIILVSYYFDIMPSGGIEELLNALSRFIIAIPVYIAIIAVYTIFTMNFKNEWIALLLAFVVVIVFARLITLANEYLGGSLQILDKYYISNSLELINKEIITFKEGISCVIAGVVNLIIVVGFEILSINKKRF